MLRIGVASCGSFAACTILVALGVSDGRGPAKVALWAMIVAGICCMSRSAIHALWGGYLTRHPGLDPNRRLELVELNALVPLNAMLSGGWIWLGLGHFGEPEPNIPAAPAILLWALVTVVAMETVRCVRRTGKKRGTEIVCEGPVGKWFRDFFDTADPRSGLVHRFMVFLRYPNGPKTVSRFLMAAVATLLIPLAVHTSNAVGHRFHRLLYGAPTPDAGPREKSLESNGETASDTAGKRTWGASEEPTWEEQCGGPYDGRPAPSPNREQLASLFETAGAKVAGCPSPAEQVAGEENVWYAAAYCGSELRSLGLTAPGYLPTILYQQAARFATERAREGTLLGASSRWRFRAGDVYVINTEAGSYVLARSRSSTGRIEPRPGSLPCESYTTGNVPYSVLPPGLVTLWLEVADTRWAWPRSLGQGRFELVSEHPAAKRLASATCVSDIECTLSFHGEKRITPGSLYTSIPEIANVAHR
jgi:hypothetical protein